MRQWSTRTSYIPRILFQRFSGVASGQPTAGHQTELEAYTFLLEFDAGEPYVGS